MEGGAKTRLPVRERARPRPLGWPGGRRQGAGAGLGRGQRLRLGLRREAVPVERRGRVRGCGAPLAARSLARRRLLQVRRLVRIAPPHPRSRFCVSFVPFL